MADPKQLLTERFSHAIVSAFGEEHAGVDPVIRPAQHPRFGDYQANVALGLARSLGMAPREVAQRIVDRLDVADFAEAPEIAGPGFVNIRLRAEFLAREATRLAADPRLGVGIRGRPETVVVDYSAPNVAKEMHVGHLRSTIIGDALARILEFRGDHVIRQNHLGDWGTQFGVLIEYLVETDRAAALLEPGAEALDLTALYREGVARFESDPSFAARARNRVVALQGGDAQTLAIWRHLVDVSARHFGEVYRRLGVTLTPEHIRGESFYNPMLDAVVEDLERAGLARENRGALCVFPPGFQARDGEPLPLIVRKSDGGYPYAATDLAAIRFRVEKLGATRIAYVVDARQAQHFAMVFATARMAGWLDGAQAEHVAFGTILGEDGRPFKTRSGETPRLADLLDEAVRRAADVVAVKSPDLGPEETQRVAEVVGIGAVKFADLSGDRTRDYVFSWERMLAMDGNTAPYLQYAYARARSILRKAGEPEEGGAEVVVGHPAERALVLQLLGFGEAVAAAAETLEPHRIAVCLFDTATLYSSFFEQCPVLAAPTPELRRSRLVLCDLTAQVLRQGLSLLGIEVLEKM